MRLSLRRALPDLMAYVAFFVLGMFWDQDWDRTKASIYASFSTVICISFLLRWLNSHSDGPAA